MTKEINKKLNYFIKIKNLQKNWSSTLQKPRKTRKRPRTAPPVHLRTFTIEMGDIYKLILGFQYCQVVRVHSIALEHDFALTMGTSALKRTCFRIGQIL